MKKTITKYFSSTLSAVKTLLSLAFKAFSSLSVSDIFTLFGSISIFVGINIQFGVGWAFIAFGIILLFLAVLPFILNSRKHDS